MQSEVYFLPFKGKRDGFLKGIGRMLDLLGIEEAVRPGDLCAVKVHFGEEGNTTFLRPLYVRPIVERVRALGAKPFLTDTNTLYKGSRSDAPSHIETALRHGFGFEVAGAPVIIADGLKGNDTVMVRIEGEVYGEVEVARAIFEAHSMVVVSHFKGHDLAGFGGALKNLGMGCTGRRGKLIQHSEVSPKVNRRRCTGCGRCEGECPSGAITLKERKAFIDEGRCTGCGQCIVMCPQKAIDIRWKRDPKIFQKKMIEHALGALKGKEGRVLFLNFLLYVTPLCDCWSRSDPPIVPDIGILGSRDPVALDQASVDLVNAQPGISSLEGFGPGTDKFGAVHKGIDWSFQLEHAERLGLGSRSYRLLELS